MDSVYWHDGEWSSEHRALLGLSDNSFWMGNSVFDGARAYEGVTPDLEKHCERLLHSATHMLMRPTLDKDRLVAICREGVALFEPGAELYIRPMFFARGGFIVPDPDTTECAVVIHRAPMPRDSFSACSAPFRRPSPDMAPTLAKASCLYPLTQQALHYARQRGFDNALLCNAAGEVAEFATCNIMVVRDSTVYTPAPDGTFLAGITRARVMELLRDAGIEVVECRMPWQDVLEADEVFSTGNFGKVLPVHRIDDRHYPHGPVTQLAHDLYRAFAHGSSHASVATA
ncbi:MAG TPA: branched-chain amino acid aminotransferase [Frateuria sp.]|uniref:branched-chain amino acid aminotransferase n=1 Tax=Frateuria sp. TaxID=2211372 RepID=UPI002D7ECDD1|nr:branched-chain amino acid aminotransferase [Frateuria sp.]HET6805634.1 branched-chain amino acid aminotransferase [Frateuria sp.]